MANQRALPQTARIWIIRVIVWPVLLVEVLVVSGVITAPNTELTWYWPAYMIFFYLLFFELGIFLTREDRTHQAYWIVVGIFVALGIIADAAGEIFNLYETIPIYDNLVHSTSVPFVMSAAALAIGRILVEKYKLQRVPFLLPYFILTSAMLLMVFHEFFELAADLLTHSNIGTGATDIHDTAFDLLYDLIGTLVFIGGLALYQKILGRTVTPD